MAPEDFEKIIKEVEKLKQEIHAILGNRLTYPKSVVGVAKDKPLKEQEIEKIKDCLDESIRLVDARLIQFLDWTKEEAGRSKSENR